MSDEITPSELQGPACIRCGNSNNLIGGQQFGDSPADAELAVFACTDCMRDVDSMVNAPWAPPLYLIALLTPHDPKEHLEETLPPHQLAHLPMERKTIALRATLVAHQLLVAAERVLHPGSEEKPLEALTVFVNRIHAATRGRDPNKGDPIRREAHMFAIECIRHCAEDEFKYDDELEVAVIKMRVFYPELDPSTDLFLDAVDAWREAGKGSYDVSKWEAVCAFLRIENTKTTRESLHSAWKVWKGENRNPSVSTLLPRALTEARVIGLEQREKRKPMSLTELKQHLEQQAAKLEREGKIR